MSEQNFEELLGALDQIAAESGEALVKSMAAAEEIDKPKTDGDDLPPNPEDDEDKEPLAKSLPATPEADALAAAAAAAGAEVVDAGEMLKSLGAVDERVTGLEGTLMKSMGAALNAIKVQGELIKSLTERLDAIGSMGAGRKSAVTITEKPGVDGVLAKSEGGITPEELMLKCNQAFDAKQLTGNELNTVSVALRSGQPVPAEILTKVARLG